MKTRPNHIDRSFGQDAVESIGTMSKDQTHSSSRLSVKRSCVRIRFSRFSAFAKWGARVHSNLSSPSDIAIAYLCSSSNGWRKWSFNFFKEIKIGTEYIWSSKISLHWCSSSVVIFNSLSLRTSRAKLR